VRVGFRIPLVRAILVACAVACAWTGSPVRACTIEVTSHRSDYRHARAVFVGEVLSVEEDPAAQGSAKYVIHLRVEKRWKGPKTTELAIRSDLGRVCGGPRFATGQRYLVYAGESAEEEDQSTLVASSSPRSHALPSDHPDRAAERRQLDSRWFRWRARLPF
jgi:hypothetical protein